VRTRYTRERELCEVETGARRVRFKPEVSIRAVFNKDRVGVGARCKRASYACSVFSIYILN